MKKNTGAIIVCSLLVVFAVTIYNKSIPNQIAAAEQAQAASPRVRTVADPNQNLGGPYCDRLAAVGKSLVNGRDKGTRQTTVETAVTNTAEISENERVMYRQMIKTVYSEPSLTEDAMYERTHKACDDTVTELTQAAESDDS